MMWLRKKIDQLFLRITDNSLTSKPAKERYSQFRITLLIAITIIAIIPSALLAVVSYFRYLDLIHRQSANHIRWHLQYVSSNFEKHISSLVFLAQSTVNQISSAHIENSNHLQNLLHLMQQKEESLMAIDLLSFDGKLLASTNQKFSSEFNHTDLEWFLLAQQNGSAISKIDTTAAPIFNIATLVKIGTHKTDLVCKMSFDGDSLESTIKKINANAMEDIFIIDKDGILQSSSLYHGERGRYFPVTASLSKPSFTSISKIWGMGNIFYASTPVNGTPWNLVLIKDGPIKRKEWGTFQLSLILIFVACAASSFIIIHQLVNLLTIRIRESDTKRMALLNEVGHTNRLATIGKLAAGVAHEINNPLAVIDQKAGLIGDILELTEDFNNKEKLRDSITGIHSSIDRCKVITHRLLGFARKMDSVCEQININHIIKEVIGFLEKEALFNHIFFHLDLQKDLPQILSDRGQLQQIFLNIVSNSLDAINKNGNISITSSITKKEKILVEISDDGPGIKSQVMEHIFDPFFTTKKTGEGTGLGLSITYGLVKKLGGNIKVESKVGEGVTFSIYLPTKFTRKRR